MWPVADARSSLALEATAALFGGSVEYVPADFVGEREVAGGAPEVVAALDDLVWPHARLYAHLTSRRCVRADRISVLDDKALAVILISPDGLTSSLYGELYSRSVEFGRAIGVLSSRSAESLWMQVLVRSASTTFAPTFARDVDLLPTTPVASTFGPTRAVAGPDTARDQLGVLLAGPSDTLTLTTHADGVDASLGPGRILCSFANGLPSASAFAAPRCVVTGDCHRSGHRREQTAAEGSLIDPGSINARRVLLNTCLAFLPSDGVVSPIWGLGLALADNPTIGAVVGTWEVTVISPQRLPDLLVALRKHESLGHAIGALNRQSETDALMPRLCLFGDPSLRNSSVGAPAEGPAAREGHRRTGPRHQRLEQLSDRARIDGLSAVLRAASPESRGTDSLAIARATAADARATIRDETSELSSPQRAQVGWSLLRYGLECGRLSEGWMSIADFSLPATSGVCDICRASTRITRAVFDEPGVAPRTLITCSRCGVVADLPTGSTLSWTIRGGEFVLRGVPHLTDDWVAGLLVASSSREDDVTSEWPRSLSGWPADKMGIPAMLPPGPLRVSAFFVWDLGFAVLSTMFRREWRPAGRRVARPPSRCE